MKPFLDNKYTSIYYKIINRAVSEDRIPGTRFEDHHVVPEHFFIARSRDGKPGWLDGNPESPDNHALLTFREHRLCHLLLRKMVEPGKRQGIFFAALLMISRENEDGELEFISSRLYEQIKAEARTANSERFNDPEFRAKYTGDNHWSRRDPEKFREVFSDIQNKLVESGEHTFIKDNPNKDGCNAKKAIVNGTHIGITNNPSIWRSEQGIHHWQNGNSPNFEGKENAKRVEAGTHNFLGPETNKRRVDAGTHNLLGSKSNGDRLAAGTHPSQKMITCEYCGKTNSCGMHKRWHGDNCDCNPSSHRFNPKKVNRVVD